MSPASSGAAANVPKVMLWNSAPVAFEKKKGAMIVEHRLEALDPLRAVLIAQSFDLRKQVRVTA